MATITEVDQFDATIEVPIAGQLASAADITAKFVQRLTNRTRWLYNVIVAKLSGVTVLERYGYDLSAIVYSGKTKTFAAAHFGGVWSSDGTKYYVIDATAKLVRQFTASTAWDVSTLATPGVSFSVVAQSSDPSGLAWKTDGTRLYLLHNDGVTLRVFQYTASTPWDATTLSYGSVTSSIATYFASGIKFSPDGARMYLDSGLGRIYEFAVTTPWSMAAVTFTTLFDTTTGGGLDNNYAHEWSADGLHLFVSTSDATARKLYEYVLTTAWVLSTAVADRRAPAVSELGTAGIYGMSFSTDGTRLYLLKSNAVYQYYTNRIVETG